MGSEQVEAWGSRLYGDPCRDCGFDWSLTPAEAVERVGRFAEAAGAGAGSLGGEERLDGWSIAAYVCHVGDNLRQWAERLQSARLAGRTRVAGYDPDALAVARGYTSVPLAVAVWSAQESAAMWSTVVRAAIAEGVALDHATRGLQRADDVARNNCHDAHHHLWDIARIAAAHQG